MSVGSYLCKLLIFVGYNVNGIEPFLITQIIKLPIFLKVFETGGFITLENFPSNPNQMMKPCQTFIKIKHPRKGEKRERKEKRGPAKSRQANSPKEAGHEEVREPVSTETFTNRLKHNN